MREVLKKKKFEFFIMGVLTLLVSAVGILHAYVFKMVYDWVDQKLSLPVGRVILYGFCFCFLLFVTTTLYNCYKRKISTDIIGEYRKAYINAYLNKNSNVPSAELLNNSINIMDQVDRNYLGMIFYVMKDLMMLIGALVATFIISRQLLLLMISNCWIPIVIPKLLEKRIEERSLEANEAVQRMTAHLSDLQGGYEILNTGETKKSIKDIFDGVNLNLVRRQYRFGAVSGVQNSLAEGLGMGMFITLLIVEGILGSKGVISVGSMIAVVQLSNYVYNPIMNLPMYKAWISSVRPLMRKLDQEISCEVTDGTESLQQVTGISISGLNFSYGEKKIFHDANFTFEMGKKYLLVGMSGSGKSTLLRLLLRQSIGDYTGQIAVNQKDIHSYKAEDYFHHIAYIGQQVYLFNDTVANNILLFEKAREPELRQAVENSNLTEWAAGLNEGFQTVIGDGGQDISGGERQRIGIARALVRKTDVLLADEITASLDEKNAVAIENVLLNSPGMLINVTHKIYEETAHRYDAILELKEGGFKVITE